MRREVRKPVRPNVLVGVISDTHGLLRTSALETLQGVDHLIHTGDVGNEEILERLEKLAPLTVVRGNVDRGSWAQRLPLTVTVEVAGVLIHALHDINDFCLNPADATLRLVVCGHSHQPSIREESGVVFLNPGSAGPRRFKLPVCVASVKIDAAGKITPRLIELAV